MRRNLSAPPAGLLATPGLRRFGSSRLPGSSLLAALLALGTLAIAVAALSTRAGSPLLLTMPRTPRPRWASLRRRPRACPRRRSRARRVPTASCRSPSSRTRARPTSSVRYYAQGSGHAFYFTRDKAVLSFTKRDKGVALHLTPLGANPNATLEASDRGTGQGQLPGRLRAPHEPPHLPRARLPRALARDRHGLPRPGRKAQVRVPPAPGADPSKIAPRLPGSRGPLDRRRPEPPDRTPLGTLRDSRPRSYQQVGGKRVAVESRYALRGRQTPTASRSVPPTTRAARS